MFYKFHKQSGTFANNSVRKLSKSLNTKKIGHSGILDPLASGLMIVATDFETKLLEFIDNKNKTYIATCLFGYTNDSLDTDLPLIQIDTPKITKEMFEEAIQKAKAFKTQIPPIYSAKKIDGKKAYEYARNNEKVELRPQQIEVYKYQLLNFDYSKQEAKVLIEVSEGTYIRTLLNDTAKLVNSCCVMSSLVRTKIGEIELDNLSENQTQKIDFWDLISMPTIKLMPDMFIKLSNGNPIQLNTKMPNTKALMINSLGLVASVGEIKENIFYPKKTALERIL
ncbi:tRNA pseudouridine(55) synthase TruB [Mycoplasma nasistruthionis]|uniref:tRNA pseudouridine(55) synthase n=1 Tax=Mycoplasma nasistruthionis TaxID=353852 RepID=A0A5B7XW06_9MOLU|nr:tRNA pseudouridine(55) synthase TruB [Mycoplasma nasistruthionis]QCZ36760.1 tRNA pseudouridine(55) synthase TruB [Mycoplasma nasistruthionis]